MIKLPPNGISALNWNTSGCVLSGSEFKINEFGTLELMNRSTEPPSSTVNQHSSTQQAIIITHRPIEQSTNQLINNQSMNQTQDNQQENKLMSERMKICPKCGKSKYRSTFYRKGKFCSQECSLVARGKKLKKRKKRTRRQPEQSLLAPRIAATSTATNDSSSTIPSSIFDRKSEMVKESVPKRIEANNEQKTSKKQTIVQIVQLDDTYHVTDSQVNGVKTSNVIRLNHTQGNVLYSNKANNVIKTAINKVMRDASNGQPMKGDAKVKSKDVKLKRKGKAVKSTYSNSSNSRSNDQDSNRLSLESTYSFSEQDLVRQLTSFVNTLNPIEIIVEWTSDRVRDFVSILPECFEYAQKFQDENIDGESFLLLSQNDLINILEIKLYSALKIYDVICQIRKNLLKLV